MGPSRKTLVFSVMLDFAVDSNGVVDFSQAFKGIEDSMSVKPWRNTTKNCY